MRRSTRVLSALFASVLILAVSEGRAEEGLGHCAASFPGNSVANAPKRTATANSGQTVLICERSGDTAFFAVEYDPAKYAPLWSAHSLGNTFGQNGCASMTRKEMDCYFHDDDVAACTKRKNGPGDPFHADETLTKLDVEALGVSAFTKTGHDRGHMAPNSAFSWHTCGDYKTFTMANMAAQWASLNQGLWAELEAQALYWAVKDGPLYVVTGPIWTKFPADKFKAIRDGDVSMASVPKPGTLVKRTDGKAMSFDIPRPTGFYKVVFRPGHSGEPDRAIAFLVPHTKEKDLSFWDFLATVELVEDSSGLRFGFDDALKSRWPDLSYWQDESRQAPAKWSPGAECHQQKSRVAGWKDDLSADQRIALCASERPAP